MTDGAAGRARTRRTPWLALTGRVIILGIAAVAAAWLLFGSQLSGIVGSFRTVAIGVHNGTSTAILVTTVAPDGRRTFYTVGPAETRLIPDDPHDVVGILGPACRVRDAHGRGTVETTDFILAEVSDNTVTWLDRPMPSGLAPADEAQPCTPQ